MPMSKIEIKGNNNQVINDIKNSRINSDSVKQGNDTKMKWSTWIAIIIGALTLIATCIIGWDEIVGFFK